MAFTLASAQALSQNKLTKYVIDEFRKSALIDKLTWDNNAKSQGGASFNYSYNRILTLPTAGVRTIGGADYISTEPVPQLITTTLAIMGGSFDIDRALAANEHEVVDLVDFLVQQKAQATVAEYANQFINGTTVNAGEFDGLVRFIAANPNQTIPTAVDLSSNANITANWDMLLDLMRQARARMDKAPSLWLMNQDMYAVWQSVMDRAGINVLSKQEYGYEVSQWGPSLVMALGDIPGSSTPIIATSQLGITSMYGVYAGLDGVHGIAPDNGSFVKTYLPNFQNAAAVQRGAVEMIAGLAIKSLRSVVCLNNIDIA